MMEGDLAIPMAEEEEMIEWVVVAREEITTRMGTMSVVWAAAILEEEMIEEILEEIMGIEHHMAMEIDIREEEETAIATDNMAAEVVTEGMIGAMIVLVAMEAVLEDNLVVMEVMIDAMIVLAAMEVVLEDNLVVMEAMIDAMATMVMEVMLHNVIGEVAVEESTEGTTVEAVTGETDTVLAVAVAVAVSRVMGMVKIGDTMAEIQAGIEDLDLEGDKVEVLENEGGLIVVDLVEEVVMVAEVAVVAVVVGQ
jgi:hypothetical protein